MNSSVTSITIGRFLLIYILLLVVLYIMKKSKIDETKLLIVSSARMTIQLMLSGFILTFIFKNPHPIFTIAYLAVMIIYSIFRIIKKNPEINKDFKKSIAIGLSFSILGVIIYFIAVVVNEDLFNPQYVIPIGGMLAGNAMTGVNLGIKAFYDRLEDQKDKMESLLNFGANPKDILRPLLNSSLETALIPTLNNMAGMGIVALPGMMTGQILSGTLPMTAILYQISIMIAIATVVCLSVFISLYLGYKGLYNKDMQWTLDNDMH